jgi:trigger factor
MANTTHQDLGVNHLKVTVAITKDDYIANFEKNLKDYAKKADIPGFRKGSVPSGMVKKMYGKNLMADEVLRVANSGLEKYIKENKLEILGQPLGVNDGIQINFNPNDLMDYNFSFELGLKPTFDLPLIANRPSMNAYKVKVSEEMIDEEVEKVQYNKGVMSEPEMIGNDDDVLNVTIRQCNADGEELEGTETKTNSLLFKYLTPAFQEQLKGKGAEHSFVCNLAAAFDSKILPAIEKDGGLIPGAAENENAYFKFTIDKLGHVSKASLDSALYEQIFPGVEVKDEAEFRTKLGSEIAMYWEGQGRNRLHNDLYERLVHETPIALPTTFLKRWMAEGGEKPMTTQEVEMKWGSFEHSMIWQLISDKIIRENSLLPTKGEVEQGVRMEVQAYLSNMGFPMDDTQSEMIQGIVDKQMADDKYTSEQFDKIATHKLFMWLEQQIDVQMNELPLNEFLEVKSEHAHHH